MTKVIRELPCPKCQEYINVDFEVTANELLNVCLRACGLEMENLPLEERTKLAVSLFIDAGHDRRTQKISENQIKLQGLRNKGWKK